MGRADFALAGEPRQAPSSSSSSPPRAELGFSNIVAARSVCHGLKLYAAVPPRLSCCALTCNSSRASRANTMAAGRSYADEKIEVDPSSPGSVLTGDLWKPQGYDTEAASTDAAQKTRSYILRTLNCYVMCSRIIRCMANVAVR